MKLLKTKHLEDTFQRTSTHAATPATLQAGLRKRQWPPLIVSEPTLICNCWTYGHRFWHSSLIPHGLWRSGCRGPWNKDTSIQKKQVEVAYLQFCQEGAKDHLKFGASCLPPSFSSSFNTYSLKMQIHLYTTLVPSTHDMTSNWQSCNYLTSKPITEQHFWATLEQ